MKRYPKQLSQGANNAVIALDDNEVAKIFSEDTRSDIGSETEKMKFANNINSLVVKFIRLDFSELHNADLLVMERLMPLDYRSYEVEKRELWFDVFEYELKQLHQNGFVHKDLKRPSNLAGDRFDNILLTNTGIRLVDVGIAALKHQVGDKLFSKYIEVELQELQLFKSHFLTR
jgi:serine/threonine protein kinase